MMKSPFDSHVIDENYLNWRALKLDSLSQFYTEDINNHIVEIDDTSSISHEEKNSILSKCHDHSFCIYRIKSKGSNKKNIHSLAKQLGISSLDNNLCADEDKLTSITRTTHQGQHEYIPYSNKRLSWHTDGYYNTQDKQINSMLLHCAQPAKKGGESLIMDHEIAYLLLRDENPDFIKALMHPKAMTIPANIIDDTVIREEQSGPVFSINQNNGLHMRYSARRRNIEWRQNTPTLEACTFLEELLNSDSPYLIRYRLKEDEGLICKNILHRRTSFEDFDSADKKRLLFRGRYFDHLDEPQ